MLLLRRQHLAQHSVLPGKVPTRTALVTGASSGIGAAYARALAAKGYNVILVARREERLKALAAELSELYSVDAEVLVADLSDAAALAEVEARVTSCDSLAFLVNNAGFGTRGRYAEADLEIQQRMIQVHVIATARLARAALPGMIARGSGAIVNVSSMMAFYPLGGSVTYSATKAYLNAFTRALHQELAGTGVLVQALCPGFTRTEFPQAAGLEEGAKRLPDSWWMSTESVIAQSLKDVRCGRVISVPGLGYRILTAVTRLVPNTLLDAFGQWLVDRRP